MSHWAALTEGVTDDWIHVDLGRERRLTSVATQGAVCCAEWVTQFQLAYVGAQGWVPDNQVWSTYTEGGRVRTFDANFDQNTVVTNEFAEPFSAQYVEVTAVAVHAWFSLRMELYVCE